MSEQEKSSPRRGVSALLSELQEELPVGGDGAHALVSSLFLSPHTGCYFTAS